MCRTSRSESVSRPPPPIMHAVMLSLILAATLGSAARGADLDMGAFVGTWEVDVDRTLEAAKDSPQYDEKMAQRMPDMVEHVMSMIQIKVTDSDVVYLFGATEAAFRYSVTSADDTSVTVALAQGSNETSVVFTLVDDLFMNFKSSGSDDMDYYIWMKAPEEPTE